MTRFLEALGEVAGRLDVPQPAKARILVELAGDMDDFYAHCRQSGRSDQEARRETEARFRLSDETLGELVEVHTTGFRALVAGLSIAARTRTERLLLALLVGFLALVIVGEFASNGVLARGTVLVVPALAVTAAAVVVGLWRGYVLWMAQDHRVVQLRRGLGVACGLAIVSLGLAVVIPLLELRTVVRTVAADPVDVPRFADLLSHGAATVVVVLMTALLSSAIWYGLARKVARIEQAELALLLET